MPHPSSGAEADPASAAASLNIHDVSVLLAVPAPTIRSWERRHVRLAATRDEHGHRRYTVADVAVLRRMRDQRAVGVGGVRAAAVATAVPPVMLCAQLLGAIARLDSNAAMAVLDASLDSHGLPVTLDEVLLPSMRETGTRWSRGQCDVAEEHLATATVLAWLARRAAEVPAPSAKRPIVLCAGPEDLHTVSLEAFTLLLRQQRFDCRNLGAQTPATSLLYAVERSSARAVVVVSQMSTTRAAAASALEAVRDAGAAVFYAGAAFRTSASRTRLPGHYLGGNLSRAAALVTSDLRHR